MQGQKLIECLPFKSLLQFMYPSFPTYPTTLCIFSGSSKRSGLSTKCLVSNQGEFDAKVAQSEPLTTKGISPPPFSRFSPSPHHALGVKVGNDGVLEFHAEILPFGTAPKAQTFQSQPQNDIPDQAMNPGISKETWTSVQDTIRSAKSADVCQGLGKPIVRQSSKELHNKTTQRAGVIRSGGEKGEDTVRARGLDIEFLTERRGTVEWIDRISRELRRESVSAEELK